MNFQHDHIHLTTQDVDEWVKYYVDNLGATVTSTRESFGIKMVDVDAGGAKLRISNMTGVEKQASNQTGEDVKPPAGYHHIGFLTDNVDAAIDELVSKGATVKVPAANASPTLRCGFVVLPGGALVEICQKLG
ncbi:VOC family protein [Chloroflexota bacterium]